MAWYDKYKGKGIYRDNDQISEKGIRTRQYLYKKEYYGNKTTNQRLENARRQKQGYGTDLDKKETENSRKRVSEAFKKTSRKWYGQE